MAAKAIQCLSHSPTKAKSNRQDFWAATSNKQINFIQHIRTMRKTAGRA